MATLEQIDPSKPIQLYGSRTAPSDDWFLVELAKQTGDTSLRNVCMCATDAIVLSTEEGRALLEYVASSDWKNTFEKELQCISQTNAGEPLVSGWLTWSNFMGFIESCTAQNSPIRHIAIKLNTQIETWHEKKLNEVTFDGYFRQPN